MLQSAVFTLGSARPPTPIWGGYNTHTGAKLCCVWGAGRFQHALSFVYLWASISLARVSEGVFHACKDFVPGTGETVALLGMVLIERRALELQICEVRGGIYWEPQLSRYILPGFLSYEAASRT